MIREVCEKDLLPLLELYMYLHEDNIPAENEHLRSAWQTILSDENHHIILNEIDGKIVSSCVCVIIPNLTRNVRPYALIENVVTHKEFRNKGYATECLMYAKKIAESNNCYKMMLLSGAKDSATLDFYRQIGFNSEDKTAFIQWLKH